jgi:hypothetical protein
LQNIYENLEGAEMRATLFILFAGVAAAASGSSFVDDFEDSYLDDWEERCGSGNWYAVGGQARATTWYNCSALVCPWSPESMNVSVSVSGTATHVFGVIARLIDGDTGIYAYVSPDNNIARIRLVESGETSTVLASITDDFPEYVDYELTLTCLDEQLYLEIVVPSTSQYWQIDADDPFPQQGSCGIATGDEPLASWNWFVAQTLGVGVEDPSPEEDGAPLMSLSPNPSSAVVWITLTGMPGDPGAVGIYDVSGRLVAEPSPAGAEPDGSRVFIWNGVMDDGSAAPAGVYMVRCTIPGGPSLVRSLIRID